MSIAVTYKTKDHKITVSVIKPKWREFIKY